MLCLLIDFVAGHSMFSGDVSTPASILRESYQENKDKAKKSRFSMHLVVVGDFGNSDCITKPRLGLVFQGLNESKQPLICYISIGITEKVNDQTGKKFF